MHHLSKRARYRLWRLWRWLASSAPSKRPAPPLTRADEEEADRLAW